MFNAQIRRQLVIGSLAGAALLGSGQGAFAHTTIEATATEGTTAYNSVQIGHGCTTDSGKKIPVIAEAVVFPADDNNGTITATTTTGSAPTLVYDADPAGATLATTITNSTGLAGLIGAVQDKNVFTKQDVIYHPDATVVDSHGNRAVIGFTGSVGKLQTNLRGRIPFRFTPPTFTTTNTDAGYCVKNIKVKIAVADICKLDKTPKDGEVNLWIPNNTTIFTNGDSIFDGSSIAAQNGAPSTLTIARKTQTGAWATYCDSSDAQHTPRDVIFWPSNDWVDQNLNIPKIWVPKAP